jgi:hypothetical protein
MVAKFSVWLFETARLYKRYATVGLVSIPFAFAWAWTARAGWNQKVVFPVLAGLALAAAKAVWRRMGDWQLVPLEVMSPFEEEWAELLTLALQKGATLQYAETVDQDTLLAWNKVLGTTFLNQEDIKVVGTFINLLTEGSSQQIFTEQPLAGLQAQLLTAQKTKRPQKRLKRNEPSETAPQSPPPLHLRRHAGAGLYGLA